MHTAMPPTDISIRPVQAGDLDTFIELTLLIDLGIDAEQLPALRALIEATLQCEDGPLSHGLHHYLFAETADGTPVAAVHCGPPLWMLHHSRIPGFMRSALSERVSNIDTLAVHPSYRGRGIARSILNRVEDDFRRAGFVAMTLRHRNDKKAFFVRHGYTSTPRLAMILPSVGLVTETNRGWRHAVKPLTDGVSFTTVQGLTTATGFLPG